MADLPSLGQARRLVIKIGSALVVDADQAAPRAAWLASVAAATSTRARPSTRCCRWARCR
jgi:glutamate 5-kinase